MTFFSFALTLHTKSALQLILTLPELFKKFLCFSSAFKFQPSDNALWLETTTPFKIL